MQFRITPNGAIVHMDDGTIRYAVKSIGGMYILNGVDGGGNPNPNPNPSSITLTSCSGESVTIEGTKMTHAVTTYLAGMSLNLNGTQKKRAVIAAFMTALVESKFILYANSNVPDSLNYPHDAVGSDNDSLGIMQQRPASGWGTVAELMDVDYNARAFYGGSSGPNSGNPPGLLDKSGWTSGDLGSWCQAVQVSQYPDRYQCWESAARELYTHVSTSGGGGGEGWIWPYALSEVTSEFQPADRPTHNGMDFSGANSSATGAAIPCAADGTVRGILRESDGTHGFGNGCTIDHADGSYTLYAHMYQVPNLTVGQAVKVRDTLGGIGNTGNSFGNHLHFETHPNGGIAVNPRTFMSERNATEPT